MLEKLHEELAVLHREFPKNNLVMRTVSRVSASKQTPALGSAMFGAVAAGQPAGGYDSIYAAAKTMTHLKDETFKPIPENQEVYEKLFAEYLRLHDYFGRGENNVMKTLKKIKAEVKHVAG